LRSSLSVVSRRAQPNDAQLNKDQLLARLQARTAAVGIIGLGYVGLPLALLFNEESFPVRGFDVDAQKVGVLSQGGSYIHRIPACEIQVARERGFAATADFSKLAEVDVIIICVPTPLNEHREPDLSYIVKTVSAKNL
jgi:UDP-N-acetyl-D-glucosamine dehydrogenase